MSPNMSRRPSPAAEATRETRWQWLGLKPTGSHSELVALLLLQNAAFLLILVGLALLQMGGQ